MTVEHNKAQSRLSLGKFGHKPDGISCRRDGPRIIVLQFLTADIIIGNDSQHAGFGRMGRRIFRINAYRFIKLCQRAAIRFFVGGKIIERLAAQIGIIRFAVFRAAKA